MHICIKYTAIAQYVSHIQYRHIHITLIYAHSCSFIRDGFVLFFCFYFQSVSWILRSKTQNNLYSKSSVSFTLHCALQSFFTTRAQDHLLYFGWNSCLSHSYQHMHHLTRGGFHTVQYLAVFLNLAQRNQQKIRIKDKMQRPVWEKDKLILYEIRNMLCWLFQRLFRFELLQDLVMIVE